MATRLALLCLLCLLAVLIAPAGASAQSVRLDQYRMAETPTDGFVLSRPNDLGHLRFGARLDVAYALNPLVYQLRGSAPGTEVAPIVEHGLGGTLGLSFGLFERLVIYAGLPVNLVMEGQLVGGQPRADGTSLGDLYFGVRGRLFGEIDDAFALSLQVTGTAPTAQAARFQSRFAGEGDWTIQPELLFEVRIVEIVRVTGNFGALVRREQDFGSLRVGHEFTWGLGVAASVVADVLDITFETWGASALDERFGESQLSPVDATLGARLSPVEGLSLGLAAGTGLQRGYGAGDLRVAFSVGYATPGEQAAGDRDDDGRTDDVDECPDEPEDADGYSDEDGCPDPDNDADGILDGDDPCPTEPEDIDQLADEDGCPELDFDGDGAADETDRCPTEPGVALAPRPECTGCPTCDEPPPPPSEPPPTEPLAPVGPAPDFAQVVYFDLASDHLRSRETPALQATRAFLQANPDVTLFVEGHADSMGEETDNFALSQRRAANVVEWLVRHGVDRARLTGGGCGESYPQDTGETRQARRANRRVELRTGGAVTLRPGCR